MYPLFETIKIIDSTIKHLEKHIARMQRSSFVLFKNTINCSSLQDDIELHIQSGIQKCKVYYNEKNYKIEIQAYHKRTINQVHVVEDHQLNYELKYLDRTCFIQYTNQLSDNEELLFSKHGIITDSSFSNLAFWNGNEWHTPESPLFTGIQRQMYLNSKKIMEKKIHITDLKKYSKVSFINAMLELGESECSL